MNLKSLLNLSKMNSQQANPSSCNIQQKQSNQSEQVNMIRSAIYPKFIKQLNAQTNMKRKRQLRRKQQSIHQHLKDLIFNEIPNNEQALTMNEKQIAFIVQQAHQQKLNQVNKQNYINGKPIKGKIFKKRQEVIKDGNRIIGEWRNQQLHGDVQINYKNGFFFRGRYEHGIRIRGYFNFANGYEYTGGFLGDKFRGYGELKLPNGKVICGDWQQQLLDGKAQIRYPTGQVYYGEIKNFKKHGKGYLFFNDGQKYVGDFLEGHITGNGQYYENQKLIGKGYWIDGDLMYEQSDLKKHDPLQKNDIEKQTKEGILKGSKLKQQCQQKFVNNCSNEGKMKSKSIKKPQKTKNEQIKAKQLKCSIAVIEDESTYN